MELTNIILVSLSIAVASATPHAYDVKSGASAKSGAFSGALAVPGLPDLKGVGAGGGGAAFAGSGSFAQSSASSFASSSAGSYNYDGGSGAFGSVGSGAGAASGAGVSGSPGYTDNAPCAGKCPSKNVDYVGCQESGCGANYEPPKCTSGTCSLNPSFAVSHNNKHTLQLDAPIQDGQLGFLPPDHDDRPGKIESYNSLAGPVPGHHGAAPSHSLSQSGKPCSLPGCSKSPSYGATGCTSPGCGQYSTNGPSCLYPGGCEHPGAGSSSNAAAFANAGAAADGYGGTPATGSSGIRTPIINSKPGYSSNAQYVGSFGGPAGILKPNDYSLPENQAHSHQHSSPSYVPGYLGAPQSTAPSSIDNTAAVASGPIYSGPSSYGSYKPNKPHDIAGLRPHPDSGAFTGATAGAHSVSYTGGFGGPPGILKPNDFGVHGVKPVGFSKPSVQYPIKPMYHEIPSNPPKHDEAQIPGGFGGVPGVFRPNEPISTGAFPSAKPQDKPDYVGKPGYSCGLGSSCGENVVTEASPEQYHHEPSAGCGGGACGGNVQYQGSFGGAPGIVRPSGSTVSGSYSSQHNAQSDSYQPRPQHQGVYALGAGASTSGRPAGAGSGSGAFAGAAASATAGSFEGNPEYGGSRVVQGGQPGHGGYQGGYGGGLKGGYGAVKNGGLAGGCDGGCDGNDATGGQTGSGSSANAHAASGAFGVNFGGSGGNPLGAVKDIAGSFTQLGHSIGKNIGGFLALGGGGGGGGGRGGGGAGNAGLGVSGSFASAQASSSAKSYGGY